MAKQSNQIYNIFGYEVDNRWRQMMWSNTLGEDWRNTDRIGLPEEDFSYLGSKACDLKNRI